MFRKTIILAIAASLAALLLVAASPAGAISKPTTIKLRAIATGPPTMVDHNGDGAVSPGDVTYLTFQLINDKRQLGKKKGAVVGFAYIASFNFAPGLDLGLAVATLPRGAQIVSSALGDLTKKLTAAVVGGTKNYSNAQGTTTVTPINASTSKIVMKLTPGGK